MDFTTLLASAAPAENGSRITVPENWLQGRTAYGGLTSALLAREASRSFGDLPPLRSVQIAFIGPASGELVASAQLLRQGKSTTFIEGNLSGEKGGATRGTLVFGSARESSLQFTDLTGPQVPWVEDMEGSRDGPAFLNFLSQFELMPVGSGLPFAGADTHEVLWWARHRDPAARATAEGLLALGDIAPPAAAMRLKGFSPVSSVNWHVDFLSDDFSTQDGWYLLRSSAQSGGGGWSAQDMAVWTSDGRPVLAGRQSVVLFG